MGRLIYISIAITLALLSMRGHADEQDNALKLREAGKILPLEKILEISRKQTPGRILEVELEREDGRLIYELEILDDKGRVWELEIDAENGKIIKREQD
ncbi:PepSY domain-containing protein [Pseudomonadota bacterium]